MLNIYFYFTSYVPLNEKKANTSYCFKTNVISFTNLLSVTKTLPKKIILISSNAVYGNNTNKTSQRECTCNARYDIFNK